MTHSVLLNPADHGNLRVITTQSTAYGGKDMAAYTFAPEFRNLQAYYPIVFYKNEDGSGFAPMALLGFDAQENLFLGPDGWDAPYIPLTLQHQPFMIGRNGDELMVHIDMDSPRISRTEGEALFLEGSKLPSPYLEGINGMLGAIHAGIEGAKAFSDALMEHQLLESFVYDIERPDGSQHRLSGFYTIHEERLAALGADALEALNQAGHLLPIYMVVASLSKLRDLTERKLKADAARA